MLTPEDLLRYAAKLYPRYLRSVVTGESLFPLDLPFGKGTLATLDFDTLRRNLAALKASPHITIDWTERMDRRWGRQQWPVRIYFRSAEDFLASIDKPDEAAVFAENVRMARQVCPELEPWLERHAMKVVEYRESWPGLLKVCRFFLDNPRPMRFARELAIDVDTKFIERNEGILGDLLKVLLPESRQAEARSFASKFGLLADPPMIRLRLLDESLRIPLGLPFLDLAAPIGELSQWLPVPLKVIIAENKTTFLTLPPLSGAIGVWGGGGAAALLSECRWLERCEIVYWGDLDVSGFEILSRLRSQFPHTQTVLMDAATLTRFRSLAIPGKGRRIEPPRHLTLEERAAFLQVMEENLMLEQEKLPHDAAVNVLKGNRGTG